MHIDKLKRLIAVYDSGSFRRASRDMGMSVPALSWSIRNLEESLNVQLFERGPGGTQPTALCERLIPRVRLIVRERDRLLAEVEAADSHKTLSIGIHSGTVGVMLAKSIARFREMAPDVDLHIREGYSSDLIASLQRGEVDLAYCILPLAEEAYDVELKMEPVGMLEYTIVARRSHPIFEEVKRGQQFGSYSWVKFHSASSSFFGDKSNLDRCLSACGLDQASHVIRTSSMSVIKLLVLEGDYIGLAANDYVARELDDGTVDRLPVPRFQGAQMGFLSQQGHYETLAARSFKSAFRRVWSDSEGLARSFGF
jgi:DNA-binding transcriptional LysR family regulator